MQGFMKIHSTNDIFKEHLLDPKLKEEEKNAKKSLNEVLFKVQDALRVRLRRSHPSLFD